jgi:hypothetical protein
MWSLGFSGAFAVSSNGLSGGLALFWSSSVKVDLRAFSSQLIDIVVSQEEGPDFRATLIYGEPRKELRHQFWDRLRFLKSTWNGPWICAGDFNEVLHSDEHFGLRDRDENQMELFRDCLDDCGLMDMGFIGPKYTWTNRQDGERNIKVRLDRAVANGDFLHIFDACTVENIITTSSDHLAILIKVMKEGDQTVVYPVQQSFRFEAAWMKAPDYSQTVEESWCSHRKGPASLSNTWTTLKRMSNTLQG